MVPYLAEEPSVNSVSHRNPLILPLDVANVEQALGTIVEMNGCVAAFKIGMELFHAAGPDTFARAREVGATRIFYDAKLCDIPNTVAGACRVIGGWGVWMVNVHALGGRAMM